MSEPTFALWTYLTRTPLLWLTVTLIAYLAADRISLATRRHPVCNPVLLSVAIVALVLWATGTAYPVYFEGAQFVHFLLGPATVALAIPLWDNRRIVLRSLVPMLAALVVGSLTAIVSAVVIAQAFDLPRTIVLSLAPKSVTAPVAMGITETLGGDPSLTAVLVLITGVIGSVIVTPLMNCLRIRDWRARGFSAGLASHGIGTARAFTVHPLAGTFAGIAMGLNALVTALLLPVALRWLLG
ncbi:LrgB family protein [Microvirga pudoricolor]|uniref:LrgB family protein n=1 Tax=Microvirga pudoricolor TaxID=2778729 RepID=UPI00194F6F44|nr:LrgB family protein [Microvirga pudoricolor]MBM6592432.1 LrgB family protein [Microvirga pudoricolor]